MKISITQELSSSFIIFVYEEVGWIDTHEWISDKSGSPVSFRGSWPDRIVDRKLPEREKDRLSRRHSKRRYTTVSVEYHLERSLHMEQWRKNSLLVQERSVVRCGETRLMMYRDIESSHQKVKSVVFRGSGEKGSQTQTGNMRCYEKKASSLMTKAVYTKNICFTLEPIKRNGPREQSSPRKKLQVKDRKNRLILPF